MDTDSLPVSSPFSSELLDFLIIIGAILVVVLVAFFWALSIRKRKKRVRKYRHHHHRKGIREQFQKSAGDVKELVQQHRSGHRHEQHPINPTLAQTGGLPPVRRSDEPPHGV
jgi:FtsZ-interacting cell division protein ZipA